MNLKMKLLIIYHINCSNFMIVVFNIDDVNQKDQLKNGISAIDLGNCTNKIKDFYNIDDFIVLNIESKNNKNENDNYIGKINEIEIYDYSGRKLNLSICDENIKIMKYRYSNIKMKLFFDIYNN